MVCVNRLRPHRLCPKDAVILAGGRGSRVRHIEGNIPKCLITVHPGITVLDLVITQLLEFQVKTFWVAGGERTAIICSSIIDKWLFPQVRPLSETRPGTCNVIRENLHLLPKKVFLVNADNVYLAEPAVTDVLTTSHSDWAACIGVGVSWGADAGNVLMVDDRVYQYDYCGVPSKLSDSGYRIVDMAKCASLFAHYKGVLEDGFFQELVKEPQPTWHPPQPYIDLGTETAIIAARNALMKYSDWLAEEQSVASKAAKALAMLRTELYPL